MSMWDLSSHIFCFGTWSLNHRIARDRLTEQILWAQRSTPQVAYGVPLIPASHPTSFLPLSMFLRIFSNFISFPSTAPNSLPLGPSLPCSDLLCLLKWLSCSHCGSPKCWQDMGSPGRTPGRRVGSSVGPSFSGCPGFYSPTCSSHPSPYLAQAA